MGLVGDNFSRREVIDRLPGMSAMGHVRYSTTGETILRNVQPLFAELDGGGFAVGHNGNLTNGLDAAAPARARRRHHAVDLRHRGHPASGGAGAEEPLHRPLHRGAAPARRRLLVRGAHQQEADRRPRPARHPAAGDRHARRRPILASETCALDIIGAKYVRDVENGEVVVFDDEGMHSHKPFPPMAPRPCIFEYIYFARPDSIVGGRPVYAVRKAMGAQLAREAPADADVVIPVPDSGVPAAIGYAQESGIAYELGIIRNHYVGRTFIEPTQQIRQLGVRLKHSANRAVVERQAHRPGRRLRSCAAPPRPRSCR